MHKLATVRCVEVLKQKPPFAFIEWLHAQPLFPKFYWQSRDTREEVVALGQIHTFSDPAPAYAILGDDQRIWGGRSFDGHTEKNRRCMESFFFLPQIELIRFDDKWSLAVNLTPDRVASINALTKLSVDAAILAPLSAHIEHIDHLPEQPEWNGLVEKVLTGIDNNDFKKWCLRVKRQCIWMSRFVQLSC